MEDSSTNPYIPQASDTVRQSLYQRQSPLGRIVKWALIATCIVAVLVGVGLYFVIPRTSAVDQQARQKLADALQPPDQVLKRVSVESSVGFKLNYDNRVYSSYAEVGDSTAGSDNSEAVSTGQTYENNDLRVLRAYNYVRIRPIESVDASRALQTLPPELEMFATVSSKDLTTAAAVPENKGLSKLSLFVKMDGDKRLAKRVQDDNTVVTIDKSKPVNTTIGDVEYQKVRYTTTNDNHRVSDVKYDDCYYTIEYDQPYSICVTNVRPTNVSAASLAEDVFGAITFEQPVQPDKVPATGTTGSQTGTGAKTDSSKKTSFAYPLALLTQATTTTTTPSDSSTTDSSDATDLSSNDDSESPLISVTPGYYSDASSLSSIAMNQPSVVRVGTLYCADLDLKFESGQTATSLTDACVGNVASGVFVSKDGYVATTGHAIRDRVKAAINGYINFAPDQDAMLDRLQRVLDYLLKAKIILQSDADYLKTGASIGDQEALAKIENIGSVIPDKFITPVTEEYTYAIQPTDKPIVVNRTDTDKPTFAYSDSVLKAKYVTSNYDASKSVQEVFDSDTPTTDVGLLKVDGNFPDVPIAASENIKGGDTLNIIGYPAYTDSTLTIDKLRNLPIVTMTKVDQAYQKDGTRLIQTDNPILPGNDGAPVFDGNGQLVGFAVYGFSYCPDQQCFGNGTVRSVAELQKLLYDNNMTLSTGGQSATQWRSGVTEFMRSNYSSSAAAFTTAGSLYTFNRWADPVLKLAQAGEGSPSDTSFMNMLTTVMIVTLISLVILTILLTIAYFIHRRRLNAIQTGHYGAASTDVLGPPPLPPANAFPAASPDSLPPVQPAQAPAPEVMPEQPVVDSSPVFNIHVRTDDSSDEPKVIQPKPQNNDEQSQDSSVSSDDNSNNSGSSSGDPFYK